MKIDWSKAPEGATHCVPETKHRYAAWYKEGQGGWMVWIVDGGHSWNYTFGLPSNAVARPEWNGTSLPPVGTECEHQGGTGDDEAWYPVLILAHAKVDNRYVAVFQRTDDDMEISFSDAVFFRPMQTAEEIAAEEREREIMAIECVIRAAHYGLLRTDVSPAEKAKQYATALHAAGYRKTEQEQDQ